ncbi:MAG: flagellar basal body-associated FliL family protein [Spirochaetes bacterium]|nr:flagellar basal body-associated FliL family protein [Spirochaetota bacterium]
MSDDYDLDLENSAGSSAGEDIGKKKIGFLPAVVINILKWVAIVLAGILFIVTVTVVTIRIMDPVSRTSDFFFDTEELRSTLPSLQWYEIGTDEIRARTADIDKRAMVMVRVAVGFNPRARTLHQELVEQTPKLRNEIRMFFGEKYERELIPRNEARIKEELRRRLNVMLASSDRVQDVIFTDFNVIEF